MTVAASQRDGEVQLSVADHGSGIPQEYRSRVLERFVRLDASRSKPGFGLGLSLAAGVVRLHGGQMRLEDNAPGLRIVIALAAAEPKSVESSPVKFEPVEAKPVDTSASLPRPASTAQANPAGLPSL